MKNKFLISGLGLVLFALIVTACSSNESEATNADTIESIELTIAAAASLKEAMDEIQHQYQFDAPHIKLNFTFGGSGTLQQQIVQGAPIDLFLSATEDKFDELVEEGFISTEDGRDLLGNSLVLIVPKEDSIITGFEDLTGTNIDKLSIGTPETVPAGKYAKESLEVMSIWDAIKSDVVYAKDVRQVLAYVETGNVDAGIVYKTDALISEQVEIIDTAHPETHTPIVYPAGIIKDSKHYEAAKDFFDFLQSDVAIEVFHTYGFTTK